uniref:Molybdopterin-guanine dinucleotide biosynthesis protein B n=1 Tax=Candidatus Kentrum sp. LFY TaxID=2126342 RepID=A0A450WEZ0_9GAMM|nr:MAG: molybdopterin-guanine dinucleotide biosynthesis protein B [Candidatus Kentron sp. LFY]VFJ87060.1 MAG: molybdopterin-guanine dinucleotide biosynthesis protein B [Candidatus Kentron sp. LFY]VFK15572.1 MAG: molybdopterin-guanine dinucleotide biosynthesis protein B [Candidatus Kentron sp. LFY]
MRNNRRIPVVGFIAWSGTGKTTLLTRLIPLLGERGLRVGLVKHCHHDFEIDKPGKDSFELRKVGANPVLVGSRHRWALIEETPDADELTLENTLIHFQHDRPDVILVEGFKREPYPKIELHRPSMGKPFLYPEDPFVIAIATDDTISEAVPIPVLDLNRPDEIAAFIIDTLG